MKLTAKQLLWQKEINRIKSFIRRATKRGYTFDYEIPEMPKRVTSKQLEELRSETTPTKMYKRATYQQGDRTVSGYQGRQIERKKASKKGRSTKKRKAFEQRREEPRISSIISANLREFLMKYAEQPPAFPSGSRRRFTGNQYAEAIMAKWQGANMLLAIMDEQIAIEGEQSFFQRIEEYANEIDSLKEDFNRASKSADVDTCVGSFAYILRGESLSMLEAQALEDSGAGMVSDTIV